jgi:hypothetical protein
LDAAEIQEEAEIIGKPHTPIFIYWHRVYYSASKFGVGVKQLLLQKQGTRPVFGLKNARNSILGTYPPFLLGRFLPSVLPV